MVQVSYIADFSPTMHKVRYPAIKKKYMVLLLWGGLNVYSEWMVWHHNDCPPHFAQNVDVVEGGRGVRTEGDPTGSTLSWLDVPTCWLHRQHL